MDLFRLRLGAGLHFLIAAGHLVCLFFLKAALMAYGIWAVMMSLCFGQVWVLYVMTVLLATGFALAGLYALSASGDMARLPWRRTTVIAVAAAYGLRTVIGVFWLMSDFTCLQFLSTLLAATVMWCYLPGTGMQSGNCRRQRPARAVQKETTSTPR